MSDADEPTELGAEEERRMKRRKSLEAQVNLGLGMGKRKQSIIEAFNSSVWPVLEGAGWSIVSCFTISIHLNTSFWGYMVGIYQASGLKCTPLQRRKN